jgi:ribosomal protein S18 acetylase RimI-like enzyme
MDADYEGQLECIFLLSTVFIFIWIANGIWLYLDDRPPLWDMATHLNFGLKYLSAFTTDSTLSSILNISHYYPPFYHWTLAPFFRLFGLYIYAGILSNTLATGLILYSTCDIGKRFYGPRAGMLAAVLAVTYPVTSWTSRETWPDYWFTALAVLSIDLLLRTDGFQKLAFTLAFGFSVGCGMLAKWTFPIFVVGPFLYVFSKARSLFLKTWRQPLYLGLALLVGAALALPWYAANIGHLRWEYSNFAADGIAETDPPGWTLPGLLYYIRVMLSYQLFAPFFILFLSGIYRSFRPKAKAVNLVCASWILLPWAFLLLWPNKDQRFILPALPAVALLSCHWVGEMRKRPRYIFSASCIALAFLLYILVAFPGFGLNVDQWRLDMADGVIIRNARIKDARETIPIWHGFIEYHRRISTMDMNLREDAGESWRKYFERHVRSGIRKAIVAESNGKIVGFLLGSIEKRPPCFTTLCQAYVDTVAVVENCRNQGIGSKMMNAFAEWAKAKGMPFIMLNVAAENSPAIHLYQRLGYKTMILSQRKLLS